MHRKQPLFSFFAPNLIAQSTIRKYKSGSIFSLIDTAGLVLEGIVAVDGISETGDSVTLRLAGEGDVLNIETIFGTPPVAQQFVCETSQCVIAVVNTNGFKDALGSRQIEIQNTVGQELLTKLAQHNNALIDTAMGLRVGHVRDKILWAINRFRSLHPGDEPVTLKKSRIATHIGAQPETITRVMNQLEQEGFLDCLPRRKPKTQQRVK